jgi:hypothetical protein
MVSAVWAQQRLLLLQQQLCLCRSLWQALQPQSQPEYHWVWCRLSFLCLRNPMLSQQQQQQQQQPAPETLTQQRSRKQQGQELGAQ